MDMNTKSCSLMPLLCMALAMVIMSLLDPKAMGEDTTSSCLNQLAPCLSFLNGTQKPPRSCCDPLKSVIQSDPQCLCSLVSNEGARQAEQAGININDAQTLPARCGQRVNPLSCLANSPAGSKDSAQNSAAKSMHMSQGVITILVSSITAHMLWTTI